MADLITYKGYTIDIEQDDHPLDPRKEDNLGVMVCFHRRYNLGDKTELKSDMFGGWSELREYLARKLKAKIILPIYMLDHSGITISTESFNDPWDSGQIGFIYTTAKRMNKFFGKPRTQQARIARDAKALDTLLTEVNTYDAYLRGDVCGYIIHDTNGIIIDSCWGYYDTNDALAEAKSHINHLPQPAPAKEMNEYYVQTVIHRQ